MIKTVEFRLHTFSKNKDVPIHNNLLYDKIKNVAQQIITPKTLPNFDQS